MASNYAKCPQCQGSMKQFGNCFICLDCGIRVEKKDMPSSSSLVFNNKTNGGIHT